MDDAGYRLAESVVAIIGIREGLVTIILKLIGHDNPSWTSLPLYLPDAWCYAVASTVVVVAFAALLALDKARLARRTGTRSET